MKSIQPTTILWRVLITVRFIVVHESTEEGEESLR